MHMTKSIKSLKAAINGDETSQSGTAIPVHAGNIQEKGRPTIN